MSLPARGAETQAAASIWAVVSDLIFESKITGTAAAVGAVVTAVRTGADALAAVRSGRARALLVDLTLTSEDPVAIIRAARECSANFPVVAFFPHVHAELGRAARAAGATQTLVRSQFSEQLPDLLRQLSR